MEKYAALIIDLKRSRSYSIKDRTSIQNYIINVIRELNYVFMDAVACEVEFSAGDEVQGLFSSAEAAFLYFRLFNMLIAPVGIRAGIGVGEWSIKVENASTTAQDGSAYHNARYALKEVRDYLGHTVLLYSGNENDIYINALINIPFILTNNYSEYKNELMLLAELLYPINSHEVINPEKFKLLFRLISFRNELNYYISFKKMNSVKQYPFDAINHIRLESLPIDAIHDKSSFYVISGRKSGLSMQLSDILGISRQSIEKAFKAANLYAARNSAVTALKLINKYL